MKQKRKRLFMVIIGVILVAEIVVLITLFAGKGVIESITIEAGSALPLAEAFLKESTDEAAYITDISSIPQNVPGTYDVEIKVGKRDCKSVLEIVDTTAPTGIVQGIDLIESETIKPEQFFISIEDVTKVTVAYKKTPDFSKTNAQPVTLVLTDTSGNKAEYETSLRISKVLESLKVEADSKELPLAEFLKPGLKAGNITLAGNSPSLIAVGRFPVQINVDGITYDSAVEVVDTVPPQIFGMKKTTAYIGQPVSYKRGVYAQDNKDGKVEIAVDSSQVNLKVEGEYPVYYSAVDSSGNQVTEEISITVKKQSVTEAELEKLADEVLAEITTEDMTKVEKAWKIYKYVNLRLTYTGFSDKTDWMYEAHNGITKGVGDCFTYYSMSNLLLNRIGIETLSVERASRGSETHHYWHMVNYGEGWYHFDACIHIPKLVSFMLTTEELDAFSKRAGKDNYYYRYDRENYPETEAKPSEEIMAQRAKN